MSPSNPAPLTRTRRSRVRLGIVAVVAVSVAAVAATYLLFFTGDSPEPLRLSTPATTVGPGTTATSVGTARAGSGLDGTWSIATGSTAGYRVREKLARLPAQSDAVGRTGAITGSITVATESGQVTVAQGARFEVDVTKLTSDESARDNRIRTMGLESNRFPTATFVSAAPIQLPAGAEAGQAVNTSVSGDLTVHGVTKRVTIPLKAQLNGSRIEVVGSLTFPFSDFGMTPPNIGGVVTVENEATLEFQLFFSRA